VTHLLASLLTFALGAIVGSFLNVCIHRLPRDESIVRPNSRCPVCGLALRARDNIPLISWIVLRGRCATCAAPISARYPLVEAVSGSLALTAAARFGVSLGALAAFGFSALMLVVVFTDLDFQIIPNEVTAAGVVVGLASVGAFPISLSDSLAGAALGLALLGGIALGYRMLTGRDGMGGGDVKLAAAMGAMLGSGGLLLTLFLASLAGTLIGLSVLLASRRSLRTPLPFGVFLAPAATIVLMIGPDVALRSLGNFLPR
jgi:leader peptidase (prepilin peptidase)/N-methyltransferase